MSKVSDIIDWLYRLPPRNGSHDFINLLSEAAQSALGMSTIDAERYSAGNQNRVWSGLRADQEIRCNRGVTATFLLSEETRKCAWISREKSRNPVDRRLLIRQEARPHIIAFIDHLSWRQYEALGCIAAQLCGATYVQLTPSGNECGIDFFAIVGVHCNNHVFGRFSASLRVVGQSKKYESRVQIDRIRAFNDTVEDIRRNEPKANALVPVWFHASHGPIVGWIVSHKGFQSGALSRAKQHGLITSDTFDIAELSALSRLLDESRSPHERARLLNDNVLNFLEINDR